MLRSFPLRFFIWDLSRQQTMNIRFALVLLTISCIAVGCGEPPRTAPSGKAQELDGVGDAVTFLDYERLQNGTGEMDNDAPTEFQTTDSGLQYRILRKSDRQKPTATDSVKAHYRGWLDNGKEFDSSYDGRPVSFALNRVVPGWTEGLQLVGTGGMIELWIPAKLGYGARGKGPIIPPNTPLHFVVELISIE